MSFTTLSKADWRLILLNSSTCEAALTKFSDVTKVLTIGDWTADFYGKNWESDQNVVTAQLLRHNRSYRDILADFKPPYKSLYNSNCSTCY